MTQHQSIDLPGLWKLAFFGTLPNSPINRSLPTTINTFFHPIDSRIQQALGIGSPTGPAQMRQVPIGELARLRRGMLIRDGVPQPNYQEKYKYENEFEVELDFTTSNLLVIDRAHEQAGSLVLPEFAPHYLSNVLKADTDSLFLAIGARGNQYRYIIPCVEVFRFFYATSSVMANTIVSDKVLKPDIYMWDESMTRFDRTSGEAYIYLRKYMLDADARFLARFALDKFARQRMQEIFLAMATMSRQRSTSLRLLAKPPFEGIRSVKFLAYPSPTHQSTLLITRLINCEVPLAYTSLFWDRHNPGVGKHPDSAEFDGEPHSVGALGYVTPEEHSFPPSQLGAIAPNPELATYHIEEDEIGRRFPNLSEVPTRKIAHKVSKPQGRAYIKRQALHEDRGGSAADSRSSKSQFGITHIHATTHPDEFDIELKYESSDYLAVLAHLKYAQMHRLADIEFLSLTEAVRDYDGIRLNVMSELHWKKKKNSWVYVDDMLVKRRSFLVARVVMNVIPESADDESLTRYVIEIQPKKPGELATIVVWNRHNLDIEASVLLGIIDDFVEYRQVKIMNDIIYDVEWKKLKHTTKDTSDGISAKHFLSRIFEAPKNWHSQ